MSEWESVGKKPLGHARATWEDGIVPRLRDLQESFRAKELPVIFVCTYTAEDAEFPAYDRARVSR